MDANTFNERIDAEVTQSADFAIRAIRELITELEDALVAVAAAAEGRSFHHNHLNAYGNRYLAAPKALTRFAAMVEVQAAARTLDRD